MTTPMLPTVNNKEGFIDSVLLLEPPDDWVEVTKAMKPGAHLLLLSDVKNHHVGAIAAEDAGLEIRDTLTWVFSDENNYVDMVLIAMARKPLDGTVAENTLKYRTGGLNIDGCRVTTQENLNGGAYSKAGNRKDLPGAKRSDAAAGMMAPGKTVGEDFKQPEGRWPANLAHDNSPLALALFPKVNKQAKCKSDDKSGWQSEYVGGSVSKPVTRVLYLDDDNGGSAARFFYSAPSAENLIAYLLKLVTPKNGTVFTNCNTDSLPKEYNYVTNCGY